VGSPFVKENYWGSRKTPSRKWENLGSEIQIQRSSADTYYRDRLSMSSAFAEAIRGEFREIQERGEKFKRQDGPRKRSCYFGQSLLKSQKEKHTATVKRRTKGGGRH